MDVNWIQLQLAKRQADLKSNSARMVNNALLNPATTKGLVQQTQENIIQNIQKQELSPEQLRMNNLASIDRSAYVKDMLNLPKNMVDLLVLVQHESNKTQTKDLNKQLMETKTEALKNKIDNQQKLSEKTQQPLQQKGDIANKQNNQQLAMQTQSEILQNKRQQLLNKHQQSFLNTQSQNSLALNNATQKKLAQNAQFNPHNQLHQSIKDAVRHKNLLNQINIHSQQLEESEIEGLQQQNSAKDLKEVDIRRQMASRLTKDVNLAKVTSYIQENSKYAMNKLVNVMAFASQRGMRDTLPLQETMSIIGASVSATSSNDTTQNLKNLMLLYLPWLPLQEGVGFDLEIEQADTETLSESTLVIMITTRNYGNLRAAVTLITGNSIDVDIRCSEKFPKKELLTRLKDYSRQHAMHSDFNVEVIKPKQEQDTEKAKAKVNLSNVNTINPYLLLISHAIIRHTIELDTIVSIGEQPIKD